MPSSAHHKPIRLCHPECAPAHEGSWPHRPADAPPDPAKRETLKQLLGLGLLGLVGASALSSCARKALPRISRERKVIVLGLDGLDPNIVARMMAQGKLPNMSRLRHLGAFRSLTTTIPPQSPVAWATFITGRDPGGHGICDFIQRDPKTYLPYLSIARTDPPHRVLSLGHWRLPLSRGRVVLLRAGRAFWEFLDEQGIPARIYRLPSNFPPRDTGAKQLAGLGAPDLHGTDGEFSYYTEDPREAARKVTGGAIHAISVSQGRASARLVGPPNNLREGEPDSFAEFEVWVDRGHHLAKIILQGTELLLREGEWSDWVPLRFQMIPHLKHVSGICRCYLKQVSPHLKLYVTPINADPADPALPITAPASFARELADRFGPFYTQGFPQDVKALRRGILDDGEYLHQAGLVLAEARRMYESALNDLHRGLLCYYFSNSDRTQHMFWRTMDPRHPAYDPRLAQEFGGAIEDCYRISDELVGQALQAADNHTTLIVLSDHGFAPFYRSFNLNAWLADNGFLVGRDPWRPGADIFSNTDWYNTVAYGLGFNSLYFNLRGREPNGIVTPDQLPAIASLLAEQLQAFRDPDTGQRVIQKVYPAKEVYSQDQPEAAPDLVIGYARGYRCSDESVLGEVAPRVIEDNTDKWSGEHCIDPSAVPGILLTNKPLSAAAPALPDVTASVLAEFGIQTPNDITGKPIW